MVEELEIQESEKAWAIAIADQHAQKKLDEFNAGPDALSYGGPFSVDHYSRTVDRVRFFQKDTVVVVVYLLKNPNDVDQIRQADLIFGFPNSFSIHISEPDHSVAITR